MTTCFGGSLAIVLARNTGGHKRPPRTARPAPDRCGISSPKSRRRPILPRGIRWTRVMPDGSNTRVCAYGALRRSAYWLSGRLRYPAPETCHRNLRTALPAEPVLRVAASAGLNAETHDPMGC